MKFDLFKKKDAKIVDGGRRKIKGIIKCECKKHKCEDFTSWEDHLCDDCFYGKLKCKKAETEYKLKQEEKKREIIMFTFPGMNKQSMNIAKIELEKVFTGFDIIITNNPINTITSAELQKFVDQLKEQGLVK